jgi:hypothetical protein
MIKLAAGWTLAIALALAAVSSVRGQGPDIQIAQLECNSDPELVVIENLGDADQPLAGWQLQSDPPGSEVYDLSVRGDLVVGANIRVQSGPSASGVFLQDNWGVEFIFRDDDPTDYVRLVDDTGAVVQQVDCGGEVAPEPSPTPSPEPSPTPSPEPSPLNGVPNGGGPPPAPGDALLAAMMVLVGGAVAAAGVATGAFSWLRLRSSPVTGSTATLAPRPAARPHAQPRGSDGSHGQPMSAALGLALVGLLAAALFLLLLRYRSQ